MSGPHLLQRELDQLWHCIDENLAQRPILMHTTYASTSALLLARLQQVHLLRAPFLVAKGYTIRELSKRIVNIALRLLGAKQARYNREVLDVLGLVMVQLQALHERIDMLERLAQPTATKREHDADLLD